MSSLGKYWKARNEWECLEQVRLHMAVCYRYGEETVRGKERPIYLDKFSVSFCLRAFF